MGLSEDSAFSCFVVLSINSLFMLTPFCILSQCSIIRTTELAAAKEKLNELDQKKEEILKLCSPASLLRRLQGNRNGSLLGFVIIDNYQQTCQGNRVYKKLSFLC